MSHPVLAVRRGDKGVITRLAPPGADLARESFIHVGLDRQATTWEMAELKRALATVLRDVRVAVRDWKSMRAQLDEIIGELPDHLPGTSDQDIDELILHIAHYGGWPAGSVGNSVARKLRAERDQQPDVGP